MLEGTIPKKFKIVSHVAILAHLVGLDRRATRIIVAKFQGFMRFRQRLLFSRAIFNGTSV